MKKNLICKKEINKIFMIVFLATTPHLQRLFHFRRRSVNLNILQPTPRCSTQSSCSAICHHNLPCKPLLTLVCPPCLHDCTSPFVFAFIFRLLLFLFICHSFEFFVFLSLFNFFRACILLWL